MGCVPIYSRGHIIGKKLTEVRLGIENLSFA